MEKCAVMRGVREDGARDALTKVTIGAAIDVHRALGPGLLESAYEACFVKELTERGMRADRQVPVEYKGERLDCGYRIDVLVDDAVIVEIKSVDKQLSIHEAQLLTYLRLSKQRVGLLINFNTRLLREGIMRRIV